jgi:hypothetical protein
MGDNEDSDGRSMSEVEDLIHSFLVIILKHSMQQKDGWMVRFILSLVFIWTAMYIICVEL